MNIYAIPPLITDLVLISIAIVVFLKNKTAKLNILYSLLSWSMAVWLFGFSIMYLSKDNVTALRWARIGFIGVIFIPIFAYHFIVTFLKLRSKFALPIFYLVSIPALCISQTTLIYSGVKEHFWGYYPTAGKLYVVFLSMYVIAFMRGELLLVRALKDATGIKREQIRYLCLTFGLAMFASVDYIIKFPILDIYPFGYIDAFLFSILISIALIKYRLLDITILAVRTIIFLTVCGTLLALPLVFLFSSRSLLAEVSLSQHWWILPVTIVAYALLASQATFLNIFLHLRVENILLKEQRRYQQLITNFSKSIVSARDLDELLGSVTSTVVEAVKVEFAALYLRQEDYKLYRFQNYYPQGAKVDLPESILPDSAFISALNEKKRPLLAEEISRFDELNIKSGLLIPCFTRDGLLAVLLLGAKPRHQMFTTDDLSVFETLSYSFSLAIENCRFWKQLDERQREARLHEMDLFSYSLAHEIDNPMHIILNHAAFMKKWFLKYIPDGTDHACAAESCEYILEASKRVSTMVQAIQEFGQKTDNQPQPVRIEEVVESFSALFTPHFKMKGIAFTTDISPQLPFIRGIMQELENVFVTVANNAVHAVQASKEKRIHLKVELTNQDWMRITFSDSGYGIKRENLLIIFKAFVTTKASSEGTGMGLYNAKNIIERHQGKIWAESEGEGKGAKFIIELPVAKDIKPEELERQEQSKTKF